MGTSTSLTDHRLLPRAERELFQYEIVRFHLEDLNALAERRLGGAGRRAFTAHERARIAAIVQAARWNRASFLRATRRFIDERRGQGVDAFGPALMLVALGAERDACMRELRGPVLELARAEAALAEAPRAAPRARLPTRGAGC
jgi:hypothetical protein